MTDKQEYIEDDEIDLLELVSYLMKRWYLLLLGMLIGANLLGIYSFSRPYTYTSYASLFIQSETMTSTSLSEVQLETVLSQEYAELADSRAVTDLAIEKIRDDIGEELTREDMNKITTINNNEDSRLLIFSVTTENPQLSCAAAEAMAKSCAEEVSAIMNTDEPTIVDHAEVEEPNSKGILKAGVIGGLGGFFIALIILSCIYLFDDKIKDADDVEKYLHTTVIGTISLNKKGTYNTRKQKKRPSARASYTRKSGADKLKTQTTDEGKTE